MSRIEITDEVCIRLGKSAEQIRKMSVRKLAALAHSKGLVVRVPPWEDTAPGDGHLRIEMANSRLDRPEQSGPGGTGAGPTGASPTPLT